MNHGEHSGWKTTTVGDLAEVKGGKRLPTGFKLQVQPTSFPYIRVTDMFNGGVKESEIMYVPEDAAQAIKNYRIRSDDIFISVAGTLGIVGRVSERLDGANLTENADRLTSIKCDIDYLMHYLLSAPMQKEIDSIRTVGAQPKLALGRIKSFAVSLPTSKVEQATISRALGEVGSLITSLEGLIAKKQAIKQGMMQQLLTGRIRLPGFTSSWRDTRLGEVLRFQAGFPFPSQNFTEAPSGPRLVRNRDLRSNDSVIYYAGAFSRDFVLSSGDVIIGMDGDFEPHVWMHEGALLNQRVGRLRATGSVSLSYLAYALLVPLKNLESVTGATTVKHLSHLDVENIVLSLPETSEQEQISAVLIEADAEISCLYRQLEGARNIKQGMMQELLTGRTRLITMGE